MERVASEDLNRVLNAIDLQTGAGRRQRLGPDGALALPCGELMLVYVVSGTVDIARQRTATTRGEPQIRSRCTGASEPRHSDTLFGGDALVSTGQGSILLSSRESAELLVVSLQLSSLGILSPTLFPDYMTVSGFDHLEPGAAALAEQMGHDDDASVPARQSDQVICRLMAKTVLLSVIRSWAENGCAPDGWPQLGSDPFLDRVVAAIHEAPGESWTLERLAGVGAMSRSAFAERFRTSLGRSPVDYVTEVRVDAAKRMLAEGRSVSATSRDLGYNSDEGFSRAFRRRTGVNPSAWRMNPNSVA